MKKIVRLFSIIALLAIAANSYASDKAFNDGEISLYAGVGLGLYGSQGDMKVPPLFAGFDYGKIFSAKAPISFGLIGGYAKSEETGNIPFYGDYSFSYSYVLMGIRSAYHFSDLIYQNSKSSVFKKLDVYTGILLGYAVVSVKQDYPSGLPAALEVKAEGSYFLFGLYGGARYYFTDSFALFAEVGFGVGNLSFGTVFRF